MNRYKANPSFPVYILLSIGFLFIYISVEYKLVLSDLETLAMNLKVRKMTVSEIPLMVDYFLESSTEFLKGMGADKRKLPARENWIGKLEKDFLKPNKEKEFFYLVWLINEEAVGHSNINKIDYGNTATMHLHLWHSVKRKRGLGVEFLKMTIPIYFREFELKALFCEPKAENEAPNKVLRKTGFRFVKSYETIPGWINFKQKVNRYEYKKEYQNKVGIKVNKSIVEHYKWGNNCDGWHLLKSRGLSIIEERMPSGTSEVLHYHEVAEQFFLILKGRATFIYNDQRMEVSERSGIYIAPKVVHRIINEESKDLEFVVISRPSTRGDRIEKDNIKKENINLNKKRFIALENSDNGEVSSATIFEYNQRGNIIWGTYEGGSIQFGTLSGLMKGHKLYFSYQHENEKGEVMTGKCETKVKIVNGKIQLHEEWEWTCKDYSKGTSILEEV